MFKKKLYIFIGIIVLAALVMISTKGAAWPLLIIGAIGYGVYRYS